MLEVHLNVIAPNIRGHGNDWRAIKLSDQMTSRYSVQVRHYYVHQNHVILDTFLNLVHRFKTVKLVASASIRARDEILTDRTINNATERI